MAKRQKKSDTVSVENYDGPTLEIDSLGKKYSPRGKFAVRDVTLSVRAGEVVGLLGANGAGKSTTLKCVTGMIPITEGRVRVCGCDIERRPVEAKRHFSFVTDNHTVFEKLTGLQYLSFMADVYGVPSSKRAAALEWMESIFNLGGSVRNLIASYSHGMKQKICMMGSLIHEPELWIADEPMVGLDPMTQASVLGFMKGYAETGKTVLFSTHNLDAVRRVCTRVVIIADGKIVKDIAVSDEIRNNFDTLEEWYASICNRAENPKAASESEAAADAGVGCSGC